MCPFGIAFMIKCKSSDCRSEYKVKRKIWNSKIFIHIIYPKTCEMCWKRGERELRETRDWVDSTKFASILSANWSFHQWKTKKKKTTEKHPSLHMFALPSIVYKVRVVDGVLIVGLGTDPGNGYCVFSIYAVICKYANVGFLLRLGHNGFRLWTLLLCSVDSVKLVFTQRIRTVCLHSYPGIYERHRTRVHASTRTYPAKHSIIVYFLFIFHFRFYDVAFPFFFFFFSPCFGKMLMLFFC